MSSTFCCVAQNPFGFHGLSALKRKQCCALGGAHHLPTPATPQNFYDELAMAIAGWWQPFPGPTLLPNEQAPCEPPQLPVDLQRGRNAANQICLLRRSLEETKSVGLRSPKVSKLGQHDHFSLVMPLHSQPVPKVLTVNEHLRHSVSDCPGLLVSVTGDEPTNTRVSQNPLLASDDTRGVFAPPRSPPTVPGVTMHPRTVIDLTKREDECLSPGITEFQIAPLFSETTLYVSEIRELLSRVRPLELHAPERRCLCFVDVDGFGARGVPSSTIVTHTQPGFRARELGWTTLGPRGLHTGSYHFYDCSRLGKMAVEPHHRFAHNVHQLPYHPKPLRTDTCSTRLLDVLSLFAQHIEKLFGPTTFFHKGGPEAKLLPMGTDVRDLNTLGCPKLTTLSFPGVMDCGRDLKHRDHCPMRETQQMACWFFGREGVNFALAKSVWIKDLTRECVEPEPGPPKSPRRRPHQSGLQMAKKYVARWDGAELPPPAWTQLKHWVAVPTPQHGSQDACDDFQVDGMGGEEYREWVEDATNTKPARKPKKWAALATPNHDVTLDGPHECPSEIVDAGLAEFFKHGSSSEVPHPPDAGHAEFSQLPLESPPSPRQPEGHANLSLVALSGGSGPPFPTPEFVSAPHVVVTGPEAVTAFIASYRTSQTCSTSVSQVTCAQPHTNSASSMAPATTVTMSSPIVPPAPAQFGSVPSTPTPHPSPQRTYASVVAASAPRRATPEATGRAVRKSDKKSATQARPERPALDLASMDVALTQLGHQAGVFTNVVYCYQEMMVRRGQDFTNSMFKIVKGARELVDKRSPTHIPGKPDFADEPVLRRYLLNSFHLMGVEKKLPKNFEFASLFDGMTSGAGVASESNIPNQLITQAGQPLAIVQSEGAVTTLETEEGLVVVDGLDEDILHALVNQPIEKLPFDKAAVKDAKKTKAEAPVEPAGPFFAETVFTPLLEYTHQRYVQPVKDDAPMPATPKLANRLASVLRAGIRFAKLFESTELYSLTPFPLPRPSENDIPTKTNPVSYPVEYGLGACGCLPAGTVAPDRCNDGSAEITVTAQPPCGSPGCAYHPLNRTNTRGENSVFTAREVAHLCGGLALDTLEPGQPMEPRRKRCVIQGKEVGWAEAARLCAHGGQDWHKEYFHKLETLDARLGPLTRGYKTKPPPPESSVPPAPTPTDATNHSFVFGHQTPMAQPGLGAPPPMFGPPAAAFPGMAVVAPVPLMIAPVPWFCQLPFASTGRRTHSLHSSETNCNVYVACMLAQLVRDTRFTSLLPSLSVPKLLDIARNADVASFCGSLVNAGLDIVLQHSDGRPCRLFTPRSVEIPTAFIHIALDTNNSPLHASVALPSSFDGKVPTVGLTSLSELLDQKPWWYVVPQFLSDLGELTRTVFDPTSNGFNTIDTTGFFNYSQPYSLPTVYLYTYVQAVSELVDRKWFKRVLRAVDSVAQRACGIQHSRDRVVRTAWARLSVSNNIAIVHTYDRTPNPVQVDDQLIGIPLDPATNDMRRLLNKHAIGEQYNPDRIIQSAQNVFRDLTTDGLAPPYVSVLSLAQIDVSLRSDLKERTRVVGLDLTRRFATPQVLRFESVATQPGVNVDFCHLGTRRVEGRGDRSPPARKPCLFHATCKQNSTAHGDLCAKCLNAGRCRVRVDRSYNPVPQSQAKDALTCNLWMTHGACLAHQTVRIYDTTTTTLCRNFVRNLEAGVHVTGPSFRLPFPYTDRQIPTLKFRGLGVQPDAEYSVGIFKPAPEKRGVMTIGPIFPTVPLVSDSSPHTVLNAFGSRVLSRMPINPDTGASIAVDQTLWQSYTAFNDDCFYGSDPIIGQLRAAGFPLPLTRAWMPKFEAWVSKFPGPKKNAYLAAEQLVRCHGMHERDYRMTAALKIEKLQAKGGSRVPTHVGHSNVNYPPTDGGIFSFEDDAPNIAPGSRVDSALAGARMLIWLKTGKVNVVSGPACCNFQKTMARLFDDTNILTATCGRDNFSIAGYFAQSEISRRRFFWNTDFTLFDMSHHRQAKTEFFRHLFKSRHYAGGFLKEIAKRRIAGDTMCYKGGTFRCRRGGGMCSGTCETYAENTFLSITFLTFAFATVYAKANSCTLREAIQRSGFRMIASGDDGVLSFLEDPEPYREEFLKLTREGGFSLKLEGADCVAAVKFLGGSPISCTRVHGNGEKERYSRVMVPIPQRFLTNVGWTLARPREVAPFYQGICTAWQSTIGQIPIYRHILRADPTTDRTNRSFVAGYQNICEENWRRTDTKLSFDGSRAIVNSSSWKDLGIAWSLSQEQLSKFDREADLTITRHGQQCFVGGSFLRLTNPED